MALRVGFPTRVGFPEGLLSSCESFSSCLILLSLEEFWKALARLPLPLAEHDLESDDTIPYIIRHELAAHEPRLAELPEETPSFVVRRPRKANSSSEAELGQAEGWAPGKCQALTYGSPRARNYGYEKREGRTHAPTVQNSF